MLNNQQALELLIANHKQFYTDPHEIMYLIDLDYNLIFISDYALGIWDYDPIKNDLIVQAGISLLNTKIADYVFPDELKKYSLSVFHSKKRLSILGINFKRKSEHVILISNYTPIINRDTGNVIAIQINAHKPRFPLNWFKIPLLSNTPTDQNANLKERPLMYDTLLTTREHEILFLLFHLDTYEGIAAFLNVNCGSNVTPSSVGKIIRRNLYKKFNVNDINSLKAKAALLDYHKHIPIYIMPVLAINLELL
ncbi:MAG: hypothetical protein K2Y14_08045 [Burkholderiales bacterium]|nr:hypothetical protein [Burkholderiales bacterium]